MSRTNRGSKGCGYDYWSRRHPANGWIGYGKDVKIQTHRLERRQAKAVVEEETEKLDIPPRKCMCCGREQPPETADQKGYMAQDGCEWCVDGYEYPNEF